jgi:hypothetical protein
MTPPDDSVMPGLHQPELGEQYRREEAYRRQVALYVLAIATATNETHDDV